MLTFLDNLAENTPVLIAGPTASGKSSLALHIAESLGGIIVNADALQVFADWRSLTARPSAQEEARAPHALYGHVGWTQAYSVGDWLRDVTPLLEGERPIVVGGTGLYFRALTEGLAEIPPTPPEVRAEVSERLDTIGLEALAGELTQDVRADLDLANPMRVMRAWEVHRHTGRSIRDWQAATPPPLVPLNTALPLVIDAPKEWLTPRIERRFDGMLDDGALDEARAILPRWDPTLNAAQAIGAPELIAHLNGEMTLPQAREAAVVATRRYAKRQRTWFRARMAGWTRVDAQTL